MLTTPHPTWVHGATGDIDRLIIENIATSDLFFSRDGTHLWIENTTTGETMKVDYQFYNDAYGIEEFVLPDGTVLSSADVDAIIAGGGTYDDGSSSSKVSSFELINTNTMDGDEVDLLGTSVADGILDDMSFTDLVNADIDLGISQEPTQDIFGPFDDAISVIKPHGQYEIVNRNQMDDLSLTPEDSLLDEATVYSARDAYLMDNLLLSDFDLMRLETGYWEIT